MNFSAPASFAINSAFSSSLSNRFPPSVGWLPRYINGAFLLICCLVFSNKTFAASTKYAFIWIAKLRFSSPLIPSYVNNSFILRLNLAKPIITQWTAATPLPSLFHLNVLWAKFITILCLNNSFHKTAGCSPCVMLLVETNAHSILSLISIKYAAFAYHAQT